MPNGMAAQAVLNIILRAQDQTGKAFTGASNAVSRFGQATSKVGGILTKTLTPAILAVGAATIKMATDAAVVQQMREGFELMAESVGVNAAQALERMSGATKGLISDADLMRIANKALAGSSEAVRAAFFENLPTLEAFALRMSQIQGIPLDVTLDKLITGLKRMSPKLIDDTGLMFKMGDVTERASEMFGKAAEELSAEEQQLALLEIVGAKAAEQMGIVGDVHIGLNEKLKKTRVQFQNVKDTLGEALIPVVSALAEALSDVMAQLTPLIERFAKFITNFIEVHPEAVKVVLVIGGLAAALGPLLIVIGQLMIAFQAIITIAPILGAALHTMLGPIGLITLAISVLALAWAKNWGGIREKVGKVVKWIREHMEQLKVVLAVAFGLVGILALAWAKDWGGIREKTKQAIDKIRTFIINLKLAIEVFLYNLPNYINAMKQAAKDMIDGFKKGLAEKWEGFKAWISKYFGWIPEYVKKLFKVGSISRVFYDIGWNIIAGLEQGMLMGTPAMAERARMIISLVEDVINAAAANKLGAEYGLSILKGLSTGLAVGKKKAVNTLIDLVSDVELYGKKMVNQMDQVAAEMPVAAMAAAPAVPPMLMGERLFYDIIEMMTALRAGVAPVLAESYEAMIASQLMMQGIEAKLKLAEMFPGMKEMFPAGFRGFQYGGIVPGRGPRLAVVHGGETILPAGGGMTVEVPVYLDGREIARVISPYLGEEYRRERGLRV